MAFAWSSPRAPGNSRGDSPEHPPAGRAHPEEFEVLWLKTVERRLKGFSEAREVLEKVLQERYAPCTQTLTHTS